MSNTTGLGEGGDQEEVENKKRCIGENRNASIERVMWIIAKSSPETEEEVCR